MCTQDGIQSLFTAYDFSLQKAFKSLPCLQNAFKSYVRTRDYCTTGKHVIQMCLNVIKVSIELGNYVHVNNYISKAEQTPEVQVYSCSRVSFSYPDMQTLHGSCAFIQLVGTA